jgi:hypothetical protein
MTRRNKLERLAEKNIFALLHMDKPLANRTNKMLIFKLQRCPLMVLEGVGIETKQGLMFKTSITAISQ